MSPQSKIQSLSRTTIRDPKWLGLSVIAFILVVAGAVAEAQQPNKIPRIGFLGASSASFYAPNIEIFRQGLRDLGYVEGKNIAIEYRFGEGKLDRVPALAAELIGLDVNIIVTAGMPEIGRASCRERGYRE